MNAICNLLPLIGRILLSLIFIISGWGKLMNVPGVADTIAAQGLPIPLALAWITVVVELVGGLMVLGGVKARAAAVALFLFTAVVTVFFHPVWSDPSQQINFLKNLCIMGGMLYIARFGPGRYSFDERGKEEMVGA